jgi:predicted deacetylase
VGSARLGSDSGLARLAHMVTWAPASWARGAVYVGRTRGLGRPKRVVFAGLTRAKRRPACISMRQREAWGRRWAPVRGSARGVLRVMPGARYVYRLDDICPEMDWIRFHQHMDLFGAFGAVPLLGVIPDNRDDVIRCGAARPGFWDMVGRLRSEGLAEVAQHGYQHLLHPRPLGLASRLCEIDCASEFTGLTYETQHARIAAGKAIMDQHALGTDVWMAPNHTFDRNTLRALADLGFGAVTDGHGIHPYRRAHLVFVPQQFGTVRRFPVGIVTICLHPSWATDNDVNRLRAHLSSGAHSIPFSQARSAVRGQLASFENRLLGAALFAARVGRAVRRRRRWRRDADR